MLKSSPNKQAQPPNCEIHPLQKIEHICTDAQCKRRLLCTDCLTLHHSDKSIKLIDNWFQSFFKESNDRNNNRRKFEALKSLDDFKFHITNQKKLINEIEGEMKKCLTEIIEKITNELNSLSENIINVLVDQNTKNEEMHSELIAKFNSANRRYPYYLIEQLKTEFESHKNLQKTIDELVYKENDLLTSINYASEIGKLQFQLEKSITKVKSEISPFNTQAFCDSIQNTYTWFIKNMQDQLDDLYLNPKFKFLMPNLLKIHTGPSPNSPVGKIINAEKSKRRGSAMPKEQIDYDSSFKNLKNAQKKQNGMKMQEISKFRKSCPKNENPCSKNSASYKYEEESTKKEFDKFEFCQILDNILLCLNKRYNLQCFDLYKDFALIKESDLSSITDSNFLEISSISCLKLVNLRNGSENDQHKFQNFLILCGNDENPSIQLIDLNKPELLSIFSDAHSDIISTIEILETTNKDTYLKIDLCTGSLDNLIKIWILEITDTNEGSIIPIKTLNFHSESINSLRAVDFDRHHMLIATSKDKNISIWDWKGEKNEPIIDFANAHKDTINDVIFLKKTLFATCSGDKEIKVWDLDTRSDVKILKNKTGIQIIKDLSLNRLAAVSNSLKLREFVIYVWDWKEGVLICNLIGHKSKITSLVHDQLNDRIFSCDKDKIIKVWKNNIANELNFNY